MIDPKSLRRIVIAPDSFKGSLTSAQAAAAMREGVREVLPSVTTVLHPVSDGGEGLVDVLKGPLEAEVRRLEVHGPLPGQRVEARWAYCRARDLAILEMAEAAGLTLVPPGLRDPKRTTTYGVGQLLRAALDCGPEEIVIGIGGSATNDGGTGMASALGAKFLDAAGKPIPQGGGGLSSLATIDLTDLDPRIAGTKFTVACDVTNPLTGPEGAAAVYGPQKGASPEDVVLLDRGLERLAEILKRSIGIDIRKTPGSGAAGGLGGGLVGFCNALLRPGVEIVLEMTGFNEVMKGADLILTGEGRLDSQMRFGKALAGVLRRAEQAGVPVIALVGSTEGDQAKFLGEGGFAALSTLVSEDVPPEVAIANAAPLLRQRTAMLLRRFLFS
jgi:glycerate kinase